MTTKGHFPRKGERLIEVEPRDVDAGGENGRRRLRREGDGVWVMPAPEKPARPVETAADRRNWLRMKAGWPQKEN